VKTELRTEGYHARCTAREVVALETVARYYGRTPSEALRELVRSECERRGLWEEVIMQTKARGLGTS